MSYKATLSLPEQTDKYRPQAQQLQEFFPAWSLDDLQSLLVEVGGDIELAAARISEGKAEQWGSVTRKKEKKLPTTSNPQSRDSGRAADSRGGRGGRSGRGGSGRGGASRTRGPNPRGGSHAAHTNGHVVPSTHTPAWSDVATPTEDKTEPSTDTNNWAGTSDQEAGHWVDPLATPDTHSAASSTAVSTVSASTWVADTEVNGTNVSVRSLAPQAKPSKTPATSKLSWAQIARPQDKPTSPPAPVSVPVPVAPPTSSFDTPLSPSSDPILSIESQHETSHQGWEEPTTVQPPTWDDEPQAKPSASLAGTASTSAADVWPEAHDRDEEEQIVPKVSIPEEGEAHGPSAPESIPEPQIPPAQLQEPKPEEITAPQTPKHTRPAATSHRNSARYNPRMIDQPVVLPSSVGSGIEKVGMQFGSLSLGGESLFDSSPIEPAAPEPAPAAPEPQHQPPQPSAHVQPRHEPAPAPASSHVGSGTALFHQGLPQQQQHTPPQPVSQPQHVLPTSVSQPSIQVQASPIQQFSQSVSQQTLATQHLAQTQQQQQHQIPQNPTQVHAQQHHQYAQHGLPTHIDPSQSQHSPQQISQPQQQNVTTHSSYFRQAEAPYFHTPTPPAGQAQDTPYGGFGPLGQQGQQQTQGSHLSGFGGEYMYGENQRGFYESYAPQSGFGNRSVLSHDDVKGLPTQQQPPSSAGLPPSNAQSTQQHPPTSQTATQPQPGAGQGPQQGYPPPVPYYYNPYPQSQYYGSPYNSGYVPQPFVKYPTAMFQPGPPGPGNAPSAATKQSANVQPQSNPYGQGLYGQQHPSASYDDLGYQHHSQQQQQQQHQQHSHAQGVAGNHPSNEYGKYGGHGGQTMQGFMGLGQSTGPTSGPPIGQRTGGGGSPETAYKPYAPVKDVGAGVGVGVGQGGVGQGPQGRGGVQQPQHSQGAFYGANRFGSTTVAGPQGQQTQQHQPQNQGHLGYPQGGTEGNFYSYQRQQQGYWQ